ncbi:MAG: response regulator, partial [Gammaproteobacteria bacterium]
HRIIGELFSLSSIGLMSFVAAAQFAPALVGGLIWRRGNRHGALTGITLGFAVWIYTLVLPTLVKAGTLPDYFLTHGPLGQGWLRPEALFGSQLPDPVTHGALWSLGLNLVAYVLVSLTTTQRVSERIQVASFLDVGSTGDSAGLDWLSTATVEDLTALAERFIGEERTERALRDFERRYRVRLTPGKAASAELVKYVERQLASVIGSSTARVVMNSAIRNQGMGLEELVSIVDEASQVIQFNRELLQSAIENMTLGVSVVDKDLKLVAWNSRYVEMFGYPKGFVRFGRSVEELIRYNLLMAHIPARKAQKLIENQLQKMRDGQPIEYERTRPDGTVIHIQGSPMPGGGFVTTFSDITAMRKAEEALRETNLYLEQRVRDRTEELSTLNSQLVRAKAAAEQANRGKTRFLAAASHDLLQPLNAARLFASALQQKVRDQNGDLQELVGHLDHSLQSAEEILSTLLEISKMDAGALEPHPAPTCLKELLQNLASEFQVIAAEKGLKLETVTCTQWVHTDPKLLRRLVQNLLSNAVRYTEQGRILLGCRRRGEEIEIQVWDTGPGIPEDQLNTIFEEFRRLHSEKEKTGLGLGLAIVDRISALLKAPVTVRSTPGKGSMFSVRLPLCEPPKTAVASSVQQPSRSLRRSLECVRILCIDNEPAILEGMAAVLGGWGCDVMKAGGIEEALRAYKDTPPDLIIADYQLDDGEDGLDTLDELRVLWGEGVPGLLVTALNTDEVREAAASRGYPILHKPLKPAPLRAMLNNLLRQRQNKP